MQRTKYIDLVDCIGNNPHALTVEGFCTCNIYRDAATQYYNHQTGERGRVERWTDDELHFLPGVSG